MSAPEHMTNEEFAYLHATALMELEDTGHLSYETKSTLKRIQDGEISVGIEELKDAPE